MVALVVSEGFYFYGLSLGLEVLLLAFILRSGPSTRSVRLHGPSSKPDRSRTHP